MKERSILFSAPMVRAILEGRKTQTRRVVKHPRGGEFDVENGWPVAECVDGETRPIDCPYGQPGGRLWVRETWGYRGSMWSTTEPKIERHFVDYRADGEYSPSSPKRTIIRARDEKSGIPKQRECRPDEDYIEDYYNGYLTRYWRQWRPSIFMPRWASRITLEVTGVRVERLRQISASDAWAEGIQHSPDVNPLHEFEELWSGINGAKSWAANQWVWVVEFKRVAE